MFPAGGGAGAAASKRGRSLPGKEPPQNVFQNPGNVVLVVVVRKAAANIIEPTEKTAPPAVVRSLRPGAGLGGHPAPARVGVAVDDADKVRAIGIAEFADTFTATVSPGRAENRST
jgi:hypothetical protein